MKQKNFIRLTFSIVFVFILIFKTIFKSIEIDTTFIVLMLLVFLPWMSSFIKEADIIGIGKITLREIEKSSRKIESGIQVDMSQENRKISPTYIELFNVDSTIALIGYRIELEKRLRKLAHIFNINFHAPLIKILKELEQNKIIDIQQVQGLNEIIDIANKASHGAKVDEKIKDWVNEKGTQILSFLDLEIEKREERNFSKEIQDAKIILEYLGKDVIQDAKSILTLTKTDGRIKLASSYLKVTPKTKAIEALINLRAILKEKELSGNYSEYIISNFGETLLNAL